MTAIIQLKPEGQFINKDLERLLIELREIAHAPEVMDTQQAAAFLGISASKLYRMDNIPSHRVPKISGKVFLRSELIDYIKKS